MYKFLLKVLILTTSLTIIFYSLYHLFHYVILHKAFSFNEIVNNVSKGIYTSKQFYSLFVVIGLVILILLINSKRLKLKQ